MNKKSKIQAFAIIAASLAALFAACYFILTNNAKEHFLNTTEIISSQIGSLIESNENEKNDAQQSVKEELISRARMLSYVLQSDQGVETDYDKLCSLAMLMEIDEINVFDKDSGKITYSTVKEYVGFSIYSGGQVAFFEPMMNDRTLELCQDVTPNTKEGKLTMYAAVWRSDGEALIQIGITPERLLATLNEKDISKVLDKLPLESSMYFIYDTEQDKIVSATDSTLYGLSNAGTPFDMLGDTETLERTEYGGTNYVYSLRKSGEYVIGVCENAKHLYFDSQISSLILLAFLVAVFVGVYFLVDFLAKREKQKEMKYVAELSDAADRLSNYKRAILSDALISLEVNLNTDELSYGVWKDDNGNDVPLGDILGLDIPCSYDKYINLWHEKFVKRDITEVFSGSTDREYLIDTFNRGESEVTFDYEAKTISGRSTWLRRSICMTQNSAGEVIAYTSVKDIEPLVKQSRREEAYVRSLATEYDSIAVVNIEPDKNDDRIVIHSRLSSGLGDIIDRETAEEENYSRKIKGFSRFVHPDDRQFFIDNTKREQIISSFDEGRTHIVNFRIQRDEESYIYYQMRFIPLSDDDGKLVGMIACLRNIDDEIRKETGIRKELEDAKIAAEAASRAKTSFLFNMSHDIRTPMNAIIGFTDIAEKHIDDKERVSESLSKVKMASNHLLSLINDVLDMSRVESGTVKIEEAPLCVDVARDNLYSILNGSAEAKNITFTSAIDSSVVHHWICADRLRMMRVLTNIISNSVKYTKPGGKIDLVTEELPCDKEVYAK
ncbi:MAG: PAS domain-containing protein [Firmicutes bacterium]|nr:PAS domain-containing protein [Candidatus Colimorpha enterica]